MTATHGASLNTGLKMKKQAKVKWVTWERIGKGGKPVEHTETILKSGVKISTTRLPDPNRYDMGGNMEFFRNIAGMLLGKPTPKDDDLFETMVFDAEGRGDLEVWHYKTLKAAEAGHLKMVTKWQKKEKRP